MGNVFIEMLIILALLVTNGALAGAEIAIVASKRVTLQQMYNSGDSRASIALDLMDNPNRMFSTIQIGITFIGIAAGAFGGATFAVKLSEYLLEIPLLAGYASILSYGIIVVFISYLTLIIGELVPKRLAYGNPEAMSAFLARSLLILSYISAPVVKVLSVSTEILLRLLGAKSTGKPEVTEEEIRILIKQGADEGLFDEAEHDLVERVLRLDDKRITAIMTPENKVVCLDVNDDSSVNRKKVIDHDFTRFIVCEGSMNRILGAAHVKQLLTDCYAERDFDPKRKLEPVMFVTENLRVLEGLLKFKESKESIAIVINEYGNVQGIVTITDFLKAIVGSVGSLEQVYSQYVVQRDDGSWLVEGSAGIDKLKYIMNVSLLPGEERDNYATVAGFVMYYLDRVPKEGDSFYWDKWRIEIVDMDGLRIDKVLVIRPGDDHLE